VLKTKNLVEGLVFPEGPRWHEGKLWFSDQHAHKVMTADLKGNVETIVEVPGQPSGLGWLPDGRLLVVSMTDRCLLRLDGHKLTRLADLKHLASFYCNDMVVDRQGRAYVGNFGFDLDAGKPYRPAEIVMVNPDGEARIVASDLAFPNGTVITPDGRTLIVGETLAQRLTAFDIAPDGSLKRQRIWAQLDQITPDGICLDAENAIWIASPVDSAVLRVCEGGKVTHRVKIKTPPFACMLGGPDRRTLFVATAESSNPEEVKAKRSGRIETVRVEVPGAGLP